MPDSTPSSGRRWLNIALVASLAVNLFIVGALIGRPFFDGPPPRDRPGGPLGEGPHLFVRALGPEDGRQAMEIFREHRDGVRTNFRELRAAREELHEAIVAEPYDEATVRAAFERIREAHGGIATAIQEPFIEVLSTLNAEQRAKVAEAMETRLKRPRDGKPGDRPEDERDGDRMPPPPPPMEDE